MTEPRNGHVDWRSWAFDYSVLGREGLSLLDGRFRGRQAFHKLSLPVIRVKYTQDEDVWHNPIFGNGCGPYNDQITWDTEDFGENLNPISGPHHLVKISNCGDRYICIRDGDDELELGVYARIGAYHIYQAWYLHDDGMIFPRVFSKGLSCNLDHWHHPYWRFDFDVDGSSQQRMNVFEGSNWIGYVTGEGHLMNEWWRDASYNIENLDTGMRVWIYPPQLNEEEGIVGPTDFSRFDGYVRKYREDEDRAWPHPPEDDISFSVHENPDNGDIVFWSICHLSHHASEGKDHWHSVGPAIWFEAPPRRELRPEEYRRVRVTGSIHVKDFGVFEDDWGHFQFDETRFIDTDARFSDIGVVRGPVGDVTAKIRFKLELNTDLSVNVSFTAELFDEDQRVSSVGNSVNVLRDAAIGWSGMHLHDYHVGDPDTADIDFTISNDQT